VVPPETIAGQPAKRNLAQLAALIKTRLKRMQYRPGLIDGFLAKTGLDLTLT
jgi:predicted nucleic acid-binding protein